MQERSRDGLRFQILERQSLKEMAYRGLCCVVQRETRTHPAALCAAAAALVLLPLCAAAQTPIPGEQDLGILYTLTHLHWSAYLILFIIFVLSVLNLFYQSRVSQRFSSGEQAVPTTGRAPGGLRGAPASGPSTPWKGRAGRRSDLGAPVEPDVDVPPEESTVSPARKVRRGEASTPPTPLDGVDHPLPSFGAGEDAEHPDLPRGEVEFEQKSRVKPFRFTSAVDFPSPEEIERREHEKLVVSGIVKGIDGKGIGSVMVYLTDESGNRLGQSCRSLPQTGEFKVQINEPGKYILRAHKRGMVMENSSPSVLPLESGKIEGYTLQMIPEGTVIRGKVVPESGVVLPEAVEVTCTRDGGDFAQSVRMDENNEFRFFGIPHESRYILEAKETDGTVLGVSEPVETGRKREIQCNIVVSRTSEEKDSQVSAEENWTEDEEPPTENPDATATDHAHRT